MCFSKRKEDKKDNGKGFGAKAGCCGCGLAALKRTAGITDDDIVYASMKSEVCCVSVVDQDVR